MVYGDLIDEAGYAEPGVRLRSNNSVFYYYAESTDGGTSVWSGDEYREFDGQSWPMKRKELTLDADGDWSLGIRCNGLRRRAAIVSRLLESAVSPTTVV